ncbi:ubiquinol oxidase mitochondrial [Tripterygium wilfordii]|uniref:Ubiquinol oxidase mitochondrial n=1 Tax=Tripterygium wilfordii TaxID=458696 RepID=A0A7J7DC66_TRIWF|nr:ubiquinol oxidase mitochondrial [Tripterygium wilfordii]
MAGSVKGMPPVEVSELGGQNCMSFGVFYWKRMMSSTSAETDKVLAPNEKEKDKKENSLTEEQKRKEAGVVFSSYWGILRPKVTREDGTEWPWNCFMPWETYRADTSIDLGRHHVPKTFLDKFAYRTVKILRITTDMFFQVCCLLRSCTYA